MMSDSYKNTSSLSISLKRLAIIFFDLSVYFKTSEFVCWRTVYTNTVYISQNNHDLDNYVHQYVLTSYIQNASSYLTFCLHTFRVSRKHDHYLYDPSCIKLAQTWLYFSIATRANSRKHERRDRGEFYQNRRLHSFL